MTRKLILIMRIKTRISDDNGTDNVDEEDNDYNRIGVSSRIG